MPLIEEQVTIDVDLRRAWDYLADPAHLPVWESALEDAEQVGTGPPGTGTRWRGTARYLGRRIPWETEFAEWAPPHHRVQRTTGGPLRFVLTMNLEAADRAGTRLTYRSEIEPGLGGVFGRIAEPFVVRALARTLRANLQTLKGLVEGEHEAPRP
jgi:carbon monoxide dehydrogenase subunit G